MQCKSEEHVNVYQAVRVAECFPPQIKFICSVCGLEGLDLVPIENYTEYDLIKKSKNEGAFDGN